MDSTGEIFKNVEQFSKIIKIQKMEKGLVSTMINSNIMHKLILISIQWFIQSICYKPSSTKAQQDSADISYKNV